MFDVERTSIPATELTPAQLDRQTVVKIDQWIEVDSTEARELDDQYWLTKKWLKIGVDAGYIHIDVNGRLWGKNAEGNRFDPYHFTHYGRLIGYRMSVRAAN